jgi:hypothetical protein
VLADLAAEVRDGRSETRALRAKVQQRGDERGWLSCYDKAAPLS